MSVRVLIIEDQLLVRLGIGRVLGDAGGFEIVGEASTADEGFELFRRLGPDVTIFGLRLPETCAVDELDRFLAADPRAGIVILADRSGDAEIRRSLEKGALGYVCKDVSAGDLTEALRTVAAGRRYVPGVIAGVLSETLGQEELTPTEQRVLEMLVGGMSNREIGFALEITGNTVKTHVRNIYDKLGVSDRTSAATTAIRRGLVRIDV